MRTFCRQHGATACHGSSHAQHQRLNGRHLPTHILRTLQMLKERASGMYRLSAFYFARTASDLPMDCAIPTVFIIIIYFMSGLEYALFP